MTELEQAQIFLTLRKEYRAICEEADGIKEAIRQQSDKYAGLVHDLRDRAASLQLDRASLLSDAEKLCDRLERYQQLLAAKADRQERLKPFGDTFGPVA
jgi:hypothetical protein